MKKNLRFYLITLNVFILLSLFALSTYAQAPTITSVAPLKGPVGTLVTLTGTNFNTDPTKNIVFFGAAIAQVDHVVSATELVVKAPIQADNQYISLYNYDTHLSAEANVTFNLTYSATGAISFGAATTFPLDAYTGYSIQVKDMDGDGKVDIIAQTNYSIYVYKNASTKGAVVFAQPIIIPMVNSGIPMVRVEDLDGDGQQDLAVVHRGQKKMYMFLNNTIETNNQLHFKTEQIITLTNIVEDLAISDLDGDGKKELITLNQDDIGTDYKVSVYLNTSQPGNLTYAAQKDFFAVPPVYDVRNIRVGDLIGSNGKKDIIIGSEGDHSIVILENVSAIGNLLFQKTAFPAIGLAYHFVLGDFNEDNLMDIAVRTGSKIVVKINQGNGSFKTDVEYPVMSSAVNSLSVGDMNGDGHLDLIEASNTGGKTFRVFQNNPLALGTFLAPSTHNTDVIPYIDRLVDVDGDGKLDMLIGTTDSQTLSVLLNTQASAPDVKTLDATDITVTNIYNSGATLNGSVTATATDLTVGFQYGSDPTLLGSTYLDASTVLAGETKAVNLVISLPIGTKYYRIIAKNVLNESFSGEIKSVIIPAAINAIASISANPNNGTTGFVTYDVVFSDVITGLTKNNFDLTLGGAVTGSSIFSVAKNSDPTKPTSWLVIVALGSGGDGTIKLNLKDATGLNAPLTNNLSFVGDTYTIDKTPPAIPANFKVEEGQNAVKTSWTANTETDIKEYKVYAGPNSPPTGLGTVSASTTFNIFTGLSNDQQYYFRMTAVDKAGNESDYTPILVATPKVGLTFKTDQNILLEQIGSKKFGDPTFSPSVTNSSGIPVTFTTDNQGAVSIFGHQINIIGTGTVTIYASAIGDDKNNPAQVSRTFTIYKQNVSVTGIKAISDNPNGNQSGSVTYRVDFSDPVAGLKASNFTLSGGLQNNATIQPNLIQVPLSPKSWFVNIDVDKNVSGALQLNFANSTGLPNSNIISIVAGDSYTIDQTPPAAPTGLKAVAGDGEVLLTWNANTENDFDHYLIYASFNGFEIQIGDIAKGIETYLHSGLINGTEYSYIILAVDILGNTSSSSAIVTANPMAGLKKAQTINFPTITDKTIGDADFDLGATTESSSTIVYGTSDASIAKIVNNKVQIVKAGMVTITADAAADQTYAVAMQQSRTFTIKPAPLTVVEIKAQYSNPNNNELGYVEYRVNFSGPMNGLAETNLSLTQTGNLTGVKIVDIKHSLILPESFTVRVAVDQISGQEGTITLKLDNTNGMSNDVTNTLPFVSETYKIDEVGPAIPTGLKAEAGNGEVRLTWNANTENDLGDYLILFGTTAKPNMFLAYVDKGATTYLQQGLVNGTTYFYRLIAADKLNNESDYSLEVFATPMAGNTLKTAQNITFDTILPKTYGDGDFLLPSTITDQLLPITYTSDDKNIATVTGNLVHIVKKGAVVIRANAVGNQTIADATEQTRTLEINPVAITVTADPQVKLTSEDDPTFTYTYTGNLVTPDQFGGSLARPGSDLPGTYPITIGMLNLSSNYVLTYIGANLIINDKKDQFIDFKPLAKLTYGDVLNDFDPKASASSSLPIVYSSSNTEVATIVNGLVHVKNAGTALIYAEQGGSKLYKPAFMVTQELTVAKMDISIQPDAKVKALGEQDPVFTYQIVKGKLVGNDKLVGSLSRLAGEKLGSYPINIGSLVLTDNYFLQVLPANLVIELKSFDNFVKDATNILTPNGDGVNDYLVFKDLSKYPPIAIVITDRVGRVLYKNDHYQNNWDGTYDGKILATDTYYYYLDFGKGYSKVKGFITLVNGK